MTRDKYQGEVRSPHGAMENAKGLLRVLGHTQLQTTARYAHLAPSSVKTVADRVADSLAHDLDTPPADSSLA